METNQPPSAGLPLPKTAIEKCLQEVFPPSSSQLTNGISEIYYILLVLEKDWIRICEEIEPVFTDKKGEATVLLHKALLSYYVLFYRVSYHTSARSDLRQSINKYKITKQMWFHAARRLTKWVEIQHSSLFLLRLIDHCCDAYESLIEIAPDAKVT
ncbi:uncharacterized protein CIMG_06575 [Coccidioides immitis RS]|uniref:Uncharacterized protein n=1 Tax=Coccidioides immitis (strain RS) TaxID=246410 RepID=J3K8F6_COCIM|nr:uncharacterized protein CIMG_06575 [Coccidioides immitis RS]EAS31096.3 hypothetical protein CIMG_06575 [Coccidioides immitis RS]